MLGTAKEEETSEAEDKVMETIEVEEEISVTEVILKAKPIWRTPPAIIAVVEVISTKIVHQY